MSYFDKCKIKFLTIEGADMSDSEYFALKGYTSVSRLKLLSPRHGGSPQRYAEGFDFGYNEALCMGSAVHCSILQPEDFCLSDYEGKPSGKLGFFIEKVYANRKSGMNIADSINQASKDADYYKNKFGTKNLKKAIKNGLGYYCRLSNGDFDPVNGKEVIVLSKRMLESTKQCIASINNCYAIQKILKQNLFEPKQYFNEIALFSDIEVTLPDGEQTIIKFKGKLDSVVWDPEQKILYLNDIKTTSGGLNYFMDHYIDGQVYEGSFSGHEYEVQLSLYQIVLQKYFQEVLGITDYTLQANIFAVETTGEHKAECFRINNSYIDLGIKEGKELICRLAWHTLHGFEQEFTESIQIG